MTRSYKANDIPHNHPEAESHFLEHNIPKFFGKSGHVDTPPNKTKKSGGGKGNWLVASPPSKLLCPANAMRRGRDGDELEDIEGFKVFKARRRSNSVSHVENMSIKSKFDTNDIEPVFDEKVHGAANEPNGNEDGAELASTISNSTAVSVEGEKA